jgi:hypothetical protein
LKRYDWKVVEKAKPVSTRTSMSKNKHQSFGSGAFNPKSTSISKNYTQVKSHKSQNSLYLNKSNTPNTISNKFKQNYDRSSYNKSQQDIFDLALNNKKDSNYSYHRTVTEPDDIGSSRYPNHYDKLEENTSFQNKTVRKFNRKDTNELKSYRDDVEEVTTKGSGKSVRNSELSNPSTKNNSTLVETKEIVFDRQSSGNTTKERSPMRESVNYEKKYERSPVKEEKVYNNRNLLEDKKDLRTSYHEHKDSRYDNKVNERNYNESISRGDPNKDIVYERPVLELNRNNRVEERNYDNRAYEQPREKVAYETKKTYEQPREKVVYETKKSYEQPREKVVYEAKKSYEQPREKLIYDTRNDYEQPRERVVYHTKGPIERDIYDNKRFEQQQQRDVASDRNYYSNPHLPREQVNESREYDNKYDERITYENRNYDPRERTYEIRTYESNKGNNDYNKPYEKHSDKVVYETKPFEQPKERIVYETRGYDQPRERIIYETPKNYETNTRESRNERFENRMSRVDDNRPFEVRNDKYNRAEQERVSRFDDRNDNRIVSERVSLRNPNEPERVFDFNKDRASMRSPSSKEDIKRIVGELKNTRISLTKQHSLNDTNRGIDQVSFSFRSKK